MSEAVTADHGIATLLAEAAAAHSGRVALELDGTTLTYRELYARAGALVDATERIVGSVAGKRGSPGGWIRTGSEPDGSAPTPPRRRPG